MAHKLINKDFYEAILHFNDNAEAQEYYYKVMASESGKYTADGRKESIREQILRVYSALFCDVLGAEPGETAGFEEVAATADSLHIGNMGFDPRHWYRMQHHFPVIDEDNYDRFAALVIADINAGPLRYAAENNGDTLLVGEPNPLKMTREQREHQKVREMSSFLNVKGAAI